MKKNSIHKIISVLAIIWLGACTGNVTPDAHIDDTPEIFPDYVGVTVPPNLVEPRFWLPESTGAEDIRAVFKAKDQQETVGAGREAKISRKAWQRLISASDTVTVTVMAKIDGKWIEYKPFDIYVAKEEIDPYLAYRLIEPGYETWNEMGIYQRNLENYDQSAILTNRSTGYGCMNCHSFCRQDPKKMLFHLRVDCGGTYIIDGDKLTKLNTKTPETISALVYPSWHPSSAYVAFSVNNTKQMFHTTDPNRIEVMDYASDVVVLDVNRNEIVTCPYLFSKASFETFPTFSPDGKTLYFCTADSVAMPADYDKLKYHLCSVSFDPESRRFGERVDTIFRADSIGWGSASFPRVSPDGKRLMFTLSGYGNFSIWHQDADLYMADLTTDSVPIKPLEVLNSERTESYHAWSSNGRWVVFSSRRLDGLYTRPYIAYIDATGHARKPLLLPQPTEDFYQIQMKSYNVPEFILGPVEKSAYELSNFAKTDPGIQVQFQQ